MDNKYTTMCNNVLEAINNDDKFNKYIDTSLNIPKSYTGAGDIKLIILGQDPTVKNAASRAQIEKVLNLNKEGSLKRYLSKICSYLGITLDNVYATNVIKNFFTQPPTTYKDINNRNISNKIIGKYAEYWNEVLNYELAKYPDVPIITLGEPVLQCIKIHDQSRKVREYWGYTSNYKSGVFKEYSYIEKKNNEFNRIIFPFPHQPSISKKFYGEQLEKYCCFIKNKNIINV